MQEQENVFLYTIHPKRAITGLTNIGTVRTAKSLFLTKEDVYVALKGASVYRRFANIGKNERVNVGNVDRLHRAEYISEEDWEKLQIAEAAKGNREIHIEPPVVEVKPEKEVLVNAEGEPVNLEELLAEPEPVKAEEPIVVEDTVVVTDTVEEVTEEAEPVVKEVVIDEEEDEVEEVVDEVEEVVDEAPAEKQNNNQNRPNNKKKHRH